MDYIDLRGATSSYTSIIIVTRQGFKYHPTHSDLFQRRVRGVHFIDRGIEDGGTEPPKRNFGGY